MAASSDFLPFATGSGANVTSQSDWAALAARTGGFSSGLASSAQFNKALRQANFVAAALASWMSVEINDAVVDDGVIANFTTQITNALTAFSNSLGYLTASAAAAAYAPLSAFVNSLSGNGYQKLPGGLILQWCSTTAYLSEGGKTVLFPIAFPNNCFVAIPAAVLGSPSSSQDAWAQTYSKSANSVGVYMQFPSGGSTTWGMTADLIAIGN